MRDGSGRLSEYQRKLSHLQRANLQQAAEAQMVTGSESDANAMRTFVATPGLNEAGFMFGMSGSAVPDVQDMLLHGGFRLNFQLDCSGSVTLGPELQGNVKLPPDVPPPPGP